VTTLPPVELMTDILAQWKACVEVERLRDQQKILQQKLGPRQEEAVRIIGELAIVQGKLKQAMVEENNKLTDLTPKAIEEITAMEAIIPKR
jgi:hypothetical protein